MEFIQKMKKREFIEMGLKTLVALLASFVAIILMEGMIYGITLNGYMQNGGGAIYSTTDSTAYCIEIEDDKYFVLFHDQSNGWSAISVENGTYTRERIENELSNKVSNLVYDAPNAFQFSMNWVHYTVMGVFVAAVAGFFTWRFIALAKEYQGIEKNFAETGEIEIG